MRGLDQTLNTQTVRVIGDSFWTTTATYDVIIMACSSRLQHKIPKVFYVHVTRDAIWYLELFFVWLWHQTAEVRRGSLLRLREKKSMFVFFNNQICMQSDNVSTKREKNNEWIVISSRKEKHILNTPYAMIINPWPMIIICTTYDSFNFQHRCKSRLWKIL